MSAFGALIGELEDAIRSNAGDKRTEMLRRVTDLFVNGPIYSDDQTALFGDVITKLADGIEARARAELANRMAPLDNAPNRLVHTLGSDDDIAVAGPILTQSPQLSDSDLVQIINTKSQNHLLAISTRHHLANAVTDALVERGDQQVLRTAANNAGAHFSENGLAKLVDRSEGDDTLAEIVGLRRDLPRKQFVKLVAKASAEVQQRLAAAVPHLSSDIGKIVELIAAETSKPAQVRDYKKAETTVSALAAAKALGETQVAAFARHSQFEETVVAISILCGVPTDTVERAFLQPGNELVLILVKAIGFSLATTLDIARLRNNGTTLSPSDIKGIEAQFNKLQVATAQRVIRFYKVSRTASGAA